MPVDVDLLNLDADVVAERRSAIQAALQELMPGVQVKTGVFNSLIVKSHGTLTAYGESVMEVAQRSASLAAIEADPIGADDSTVDAVLSNFRVTRSSGSTAAGNVTMVLNRLAAVTIPSGSVFTANGVTFVTEDSYAAKTSEGSITDANDRVLQSIGNGQYAFSFPVVSQDDDPAANLKFGTRLVPNTAPSSFVEAYASTDFSGGAAEETNAELTERLREGASIQAWSNPISISAMLKLNSDFSDLREVSIVGAGMPEMIRDQHTIMPISLGGRCDLYIQSRAYPAVTRITKTATLVSTSPSGGVWQFSLNVDDVPGYYRIERIALPSDATDFDGYELSADTRSFSVPDDGLQPDIASAMEARYSKYQTSVVQFVDTTTSTTGLTENSSTQDYDVDLLAMPLIGDIQDFLLDGEHGSTAADVLVRGAIPCFLRLNFTIYKTSSNGDVDEDAVKTVIADYVNGLGFGAVLYGQAIARVAYGVLEEGMELSQIEMIGEILAPDGESIYDRQFSRLELPDNPEVQVSSRTAMFFVDVDRIGITVTTIGE